MQKLTAPGMRLAERMRANGIAYIESYPGPARDILAMPAPVSGSTASAEPRRTPDGGSRTSP
jgi:predicted nuclease with RNAse H fold